MEEAVRACEVLFRVPGRIAAAILPLLEARDIRAASSSAIAEGRRHGEHGALSGGLKRRRHSRTILRARRALLHYVADRERRKIRRDGAVPWGADVYHRGPVPTRVHRLGDYLYCRGAISRRQLDDALRWQHRMRPLIGQMALRHGLITPRQLATVLYLMGECETFGAAAQTHGVLSEGQTGELLQAQQRYQCRLGNYFTQMGLVSEERLEAYHRDMCMHNLTVAA